MLGLTFFFYKIPIYVYTVDPRDTSLIRSVTVLVARNARMSK